MSRKDADLVARWGADPWRTLAARVVKDLQAGVLDTPSLPQHEGRVDLRGINLPKPSHLKHPQFPHEGKAYPLGEGVVFQDRPMEVRGVRLADVDLSSSNIAYTQWSDSHFKNVLFLRAQVHNVSFTTCEFEGVDFGGANLKETSMTGFAGRAPSNYRKVSFARADLRYTNYSYGLVHDCDFSHAKFAKVDFGGSQLARCRFAGKMGETWFRGWYSIPHPLDKEYFERSGIDPRTIRNQMDQVDFTGAELWTVQFEDDIDLTRCTFPSDGKHLFVRDRASVHDEAKSIVETEWQGEEREQALDLLDLFFGSQERALKSWEAYYRTKKSPQELAEILDGARKRVWRGNAWKMNVFHRRLFEDSPGGVRLFELLTRIASR